MSDLTTSLANKNGFSKERYIEVVRSKVKENHPHYDDEIAILRGEISYLRDVIEDILGHALPDTEFKEYNQSVESFKTEAKIQLVL